MKQSETIVLPPLRVIFFQFQVTQGVVKQRWQRPSHGTPTSPSSKSSLPRTWSGSPRGQSAAQSRKSLTTPTSRSWAALSSTTWRDSLVSCGCCHVTLMWGHVINMWSHQTLSSIYHAWRSGLRGNIARYSWLAWNLNSPTRLQDFESSGHSFISLVCIAKTILRVPFPMGVVPGHAASLVIIVWKYTIESIYESRDTSMIVSCSHVIVMWSPQTTFLSVHGSPTWCYRPFWFSWGNFHQLWVVQLLPNIK